MRSDLRAAIVTAAAAHHLDPVLVEALVLVESSGKPYAYRYEPAFWTKYMSVSPAWKDANPERVSASYGLCQTMFVVAQEVGFDKADPEYLFVPSISLEFGCRKFAQLLAWAGGDIERALAAYNGGRKANVARPFRNAAYAAKVLAQWEKLKQT